MKVTISHVHAAYHWLMTPSDGEALGSLPRSGILGSSPTTIRELMRSGFRNLEVDGLQTEFLVNDASARPRRQDYSYHISSRCFPSNAFVLIDKYLQIAGPELSFWQMSRLLPLGELVKYGTALCAKHCYTLDDGGFCIKRRVPLTTRAKLEAFARDMGSFKSNLKVFRALRSVVDNSESPMESCISVLACLKRMYGGFGMPNPEMGHLVELDKEGQQIAGEETCRCDMYWADAHYDLEYDSNLAHSGDKAAIGDAARRMAIRHMGIRVEELRTPQVTDADQFELAMKMVAEGIGWRMRDRSPEAGLRHSWAYFELRKQLFHWERRNAGEPSSPLHVADLDW